MAFVLQEAVVQIKTTGVDKFKRELNTIDKQIMSLGKRAKTVSKFFSQVRPTGGNQLELVVKHTRAYGRATRTYAKDVTNFAEGVKTLESALSSALPTLHRSAKALRNIQDSTKDAISSLRGAGKIANPFSKIKFPKQGVNRPIQDATRHTQTLAASISNVSSLLATLPATSRFSALTGSIGTATGAMTGLGVATAGVTAGLAALATAGVAVIKSIQVAGRLEKQLAEVATISKDVANNVDDFAFRISKLAVATRTESGLLSEGLYQTISAGITDTGDAMNFLEVSANAARAGLSSVGVAVSGLTSAVAAFGFQASDVNLISDKFFKTVEVGKLRFEDIASSIGSVAPLAAQLGISLDELLAAGSALTLTGQTLSESFTNIQGVMNAVLRPTAEAEKLAEKLGVEFGATALQTKGLTRFLRDLQEQVGGDVEVMGQLFGRIEGLRGVLALTGNQAESFAKNLNAIQNAAGATDKAVAIQNETFQAQVDLLKNQLSLVLQTIGSELLPSVTESLQNMTTALENVNWDQFRRDIGLVVETITAFVSGLGKAYGILTDIAKVALRFSPGGAAAAGAIGTFGANRQIVPTVGDTSTGALRTFEAGTRPTPSFDRIVSTPTPTSLGRAIPFGGNQEDVLAGFGVSGTITSRTLSPRARRFQGRAPLPSQPVVSGLAQRPNVPFLTTPTVEGVGGIQGVTRTPIPGIQGQLVDPSTGLDQTVRDAANQIVTGLTTELTKGQNISAVSDTLVALRDPRTVAGRRGQESRDLLAQRALDRSRQIPEAARGALRGFDTPSMMATTGGGVIGEILEAEGQALADNFSLVNAAISGGQAGGVHGALIAVGAELLSMTEGFGRIQETWNMVIQTIVRAIDPLVSALADVLQPVLESLGSVFESLTPYFQLLGQLLKITVVPALTVLGKLLEGLAFVIRKVSSFFITVINTVIRLLNRLPFVNINEIQRVQVDPVNAVGGVNDQAATQAFARDPVPDTATGGRGRGGGTSGGLRISAITGASRDILVSALSPLKQLNSTFPAMLDELKNISGLLSGGMRVTPAGVNVTTPNLQGFNRGGEGEFEDLNNPFVNQRSQGIVVENLTIQVQQVADLNIDEIRRELDINLDLRNRNQGVVFPANR